MNRAIRGAGQALEGKLQACPYNQKAIGALIDILPSAEGWREVVENASAKRDDELLHKALLVALSKGEQVDASVVKAGAVLITPFEAYVGCAIRASGDVVDALLAAADCDWRVPFSRSLVLLITGLYHKEHRNEPPSRRMVAVARKLAREAHGFFSGADALQALARLFDLHDVVEILERQGNTSPDEWLDRVEHLAGSIMEASLLTYLPDEDTRTIATGYTVRRAVKRVGRNDPCPCKSGKKYKKCCYAADQERLKQSSDVAGVTTEELRENAERFLDEQRAWKLSRRELTQLDYARVERTALRVVARRLLSFREEEALISLFKAVGVTPELEHLWFGALHESALCGSTENLRTLYAIRDPAEVDPRAMSFMVRFALMDITDAPVMTQLEQQARAVVESDDDSEAVDLASALLHSRFPALGMVVARGVIPFVDDYATYPLLDTLLAVRDSLALSPVDPIEDVLDLLRPQQTSEVAMSHELERAQEELGRAGEQVRALRKELANASRRLNEVRTETTSSAAASSTPAANTPPTPDRAGERALRERIESLKGEIANRNTERARMRAELRAARENLERMQTTTKQPSTSSPESEHLVEGESTPVNLPRQAPRLAAYGPRFRSSLDRLPEEIREAGLRLSARLCAGAPAAFRGVSHLAHDRDLLRQRVGIHHRLLFSIDKDQIRFHDIVAREALDTAVKRLK